MRKLNLVIQHMVTQEMIVWCEVWILAIDDLVHMGYGWPPGIIDLKQARFFGLSGRLLFWCDAVYSAFCVAPPGQTPLASCDDYAYGCTFKDIGGQHRIASLFDHLYTTRCVSVGEKNRNKTMNIQTLSFIFWLVLQPPSCIHTEPREAPSTFINGTIEICIFDDINHVVSNSNHHLDISNSGVQEHDMEERKMQRTVI